MIDAIAQEAQRVHTLNDFKVWARSLRRVFPHGSLVACHGHVHACGVGDDYAISVDVPLSYLQSICNRHGGPESPILKRWIATRSVLRFEAVEPWPQIPPAWLNAFQEHRMTNLIAHGMFDEARCAATYHCFYQIPGRIDDSHYAFMHTIVPLMHETLCRVIDVLEGKGAARPQLEMLSEREQEIARWVQVGKTNGEIAHICGLSENTIKHHLTRIFGKLDVATRTQLVKRLNETDPRRSRDFTTNYL